MNDLTLFMARTRIDLMPSALWELGMQDAVEHFSDKLLHIERAMKTETGKALARERAQRVEIFSQWWSEESKVPKSYPFGSAGAGGTADGASH